ncbi:hypothetical protein B1757_13320 [Acidithiobacillus marinus]|uniref:Uncharacterized protein n=1 Tax=Acidithiobacillus marinus TaxID=187490 RepID=A0A2I1DIU4_9PROT|nr:hypothetical protein [Acidithiobacillus marinus]PKY09775.1 hypothetical protein B1757_13320 [Acidithiobacillus marinus]
MANEENTQSESVSTTTQKGNKGGKRPTRAPIRNANYVETADGRKKVAIEEFEARILAGRKIDVTVLNPLTHAVGSMLMPADRALQRITEDLAMTSSKENRAKYRQVIADFEDAQSDFMQAVYKVIEESGMEISQFIQRRIRRADGIADTSENTEASTDKPVKTVQPL